jgi:cupin superfamily acireductone dioxygenase involved in methionine salvage
MKHLKLFENFDSNPSEMKKIELYYERWMKEFDVVDDYEGHGPGTIFGGDSGYINTYQDLIERLKEDIGEDDIEFIRVHDDEGEVEELKTFIKGLYVSFY